MQTVTLAERPDLAAALDRTELNPGPELIYHDAVADEFWGELVARFPAYQVLLLDEGRVVAHGASVPLRWDEPDAHLPDEGFDWALAQSVDDHRQDRTANVASALFIGVASDRQRQGLSTLAAKALRANASAHGMEGLIAPLRPTLKHLYPLIPMAQYAAWRRRGDEAPFDPWLRVHWRLGARILHPCERSMLVTGSGAEWEKWTGIAMPETGSYVVEGALSPVEMDGAADTGRYVEANVWARHDLLPTDTRDWTLTSDSR